MGAQWVKSMKKFGVEYTQDVAEAEFKYLIMDLLTSAGDGDVSEIDDRHPYVFKNQPGLFKEPSPLEISPDPLIGKRGVVKVCRFCSHTKDKHVRDLAVTSAIDPSGHEYCELILLEI
jgi:hypothetical protein